MTDRKKTTEEIASLEAKLIAYKGEDEIVSSLVIAEELKKLPVNSFKVSSGYAGLDRRFDGGFEYGEMIIVSGPTGSGKTQFLICMTKRYEKAGVPTLWFEYELTQHQFFSRFGSNPPLFYLPKKITKRHIDWLEEKILEGVVKYNTRVIFVDHLHFIVDVLKNRVDNVSYLMGNLVARLKEIALEHNIIIFLVAHPKKEEPVGADDPHHDDIRDSGFIPQYADACLMIWRVPNMYTIGMPRKKQRMIEENDNRAVLRVTKNRRTGKVGYINLVHKNGDFVEEEGLEDVFPDKNNDNDTATDIWDS